MNRLFELIFSRIDPIQCARNKGVRVGKNCRFIGYPDFDSEPYLVTIGNRVEISKDVRFITHDGATWTFRNQEKYKRVIRFGTIYVGDNSFIGTRSTILPNVVIGSNCIVGACSIVTKNIPDGEVWAGCPAKFICTTAEYAEKCLIETPDYDFEKLNNPNDKRKEVERIYC